MSASTDSSKPLPLPKGVEARYVDCTRSCGLKFHVLCAGRDQGRTDRPLILLTHGFPELAYSWRHLLTGLAGQGYFVVAPDQRGYGRTEGSDHSSFEETDLGTFTMTNLVRDLVCLVSELGYRKVKCIIGHDFGAVVSATAALIRPDMFQSCIQMSHPHHVPPLPSMSHERTKPKSDICQELAGLAEPRKHYKWYNSCREACGEYSDPAQGMSAFLRGYFHIKSAAWQMNKPHKLGSWSAPELAKMPAYYVMPLSATMPEVVANSMSGEDDARTRSWMSDDELEVYVDEWQRTGFQGGLNWYRAQTSEDATLAKDMTLFAGRKIEVPCLFIGGELDWGVYQAPGVVEAQADSCTRWMGMQIIKDAGHWVQQEQPERVMDIVVEFLQQIRGVGHRQ